MISGSLAGGQRGRFGSQGAKDRTAGAGNRFSGGAQQGGIAEHKEIKKIKEMIDHMRDLPVARQYPILSLAISTAYYRAQEFSEADLELMRRIDALHPEHPFADLRMEAGSVSWTDPFSTARRLRCCRRCNYGTGATWAFVKLSFLSPASL